MMEEMRLVEASTVVKPDVPNGDGGDGEGEMNFPVVHVRDRDVVNVEAVECGVP